MASAHPKAVVKSETTFSRRVCPLLYSNIKATLDEILKKDLPDVESAHFTSDHWSSKSNDAYQALTLHYVTRDYEYKKWTVACRSVQGRHTGELIASVTDSMINGIEGLASSTFKTMTTDAAANMRKAMQESNEIDVHFRCLDHLINTSVNKALEEELVVAAVEKCKALAVATHRSTQKNEVIKKLAKERGGKTMLTSSYHCCISLIHCRHSFYHCLTSFYIFVISL